MNAFIHLLANLIIGLVLYVLRILPDRQLLAVFILFGILIDLDHILHSIVRHKTLLPRRWLQVMREYRLHMEPHLYVFHSVEFNVVLALASIFRPLLALLLLSNLIHITLDIMEHYLYHRNFDCVKRWSIILFLMRCCRKTQKSI